MAFVHCFSVGVQSLTLTAHRTIAQWYVLVRIFSGKQYKKLAKESSLPFFCFSQFLIDKKVSQMSIENCEKQEEKNNRQHNMGNLFYESLQKKDIECCMFIV